MEAIGKILAKKRIEMNYSLQDVSEHLKIRKRYLEYIENDELDKIPGKVYLKGYIKEYAKLVKLGEFAELKVSSQHNPETVFDEKIKNTRLNIRPSTFIIFVCIILILCIYWLYNKIS